MNIDLTVKVLFTTKNRRIEKVLKQAKMTFFRKSLIDKNSYSELNIFFLSLSRYTTLLTIQHIDLFSSTFNKRFCVAAYGL